MLIDCRKISKLVLNGLNERIVNLKQIGVIPKLCVVLAGNDPASRIYINNKKRVCNEIGIESEEYSFSTEVTEQELINLIEKLNSDPTVNGIIVQLPLPNHINEKIIAQKILPCKDVDCFTQPNIGKMFMGKADILPCTPSGIIELLRYSDIKIEGKHCVILGRSNIVGKPLAILMLQKNATVTVCHSKTENLVCLCRQADIVVSAVGSPSFIRSNMIKPGAVVVDVGINRLSNGTIVGDVDFDNVSEISEYITPVPGGVGPMTIAMLIKNTVIATELQHIKSAL